MTEVVAALSAAVGIEVATKSVEDSADTLGLGGRSTVSHAEALAILGLVADQDGLVGLTARFARSRLIAAWATQKLDRVSCANGRG